MPEPEFSENRVISGQLGHIVDPHGVQAIDIMGPTIQVLTEPGEEDNSPCLMRGTIPPGVIVPLHSHPDLETFIHVSGELEGLSGSAVLFDWIRIKPGDIFHVPGMAMHAFRNLSHQPAVSNIVTTSRMAKFFKEIGTPVVAGAPPVPPSEAALRHFMETATRYGHWNANPRENARVGICPAPEFGQHWHGRQASSEVASNS
ncbi:cupin domain-containing protein [Mesorhizobium sp. M0621]|uniref:cupin domain-containing protein n=1 Tax=Mesorhizobium sp. M0621 TaxID=2956974 RepID=UPI00333BFA32